jgi:hypothetical protein
LQQLQDFKVKGTATNHRLYLQKKVGMHWYFEEDREKWYGRGVKLPSCSLLLPIVDENI